MKQTSINLKQYLNIGISGLISCFSDNSNISVLTAIVKIDEIFYLILYKEVFLLHLEKIGNVEKRRIKNKEEIIFLIIRNQ